MNYFINCQNITSHALLFKNAFKSEQNNDIKEILNNNSNNKNTNIYKQNKKFDNTIFNINGFDKKDINNDYSMSELISYKNKDKIILEKYIFFLDGIIGQGSFINTYFGYNIENRVEIAVKVKNYLKCNWNRSFKKRQKV